MLVPHYFVDRPAQVCHGLNDHDLGCQHPPQCAESVVSSTRSHLLTSQLVLYPHSLPKKHEVIYPDFILLLRTCFVVLDGSSWTSSRLYPGILPEVGWHCPRRTLRQTSQYSGSPGTTRHCVGSCVNSHAAEEPTCSGL